ncbi:MAG: S1 family peptidase [Chlamydiales bacterium]|nr:S1 family peptidase [Chlamydiales bacterium]
MKLHFLSYTALVCALAITQGHAASNNHKARQTRPIQLGVSGGSVVDKVHSACCSGTLGSLVQDKAGTLYILSNTHVLAGDSAAGNNKKVSAKGDPINQPGYIDVNCLQKTADYVAVLSNWIPIVPNGVTSVDAAIAQIDTHMVDTSGSILEIGKISSTPVDAFVGQKVKKSGRTSGLTKGTVTGLHATITVGYTDECGGNEFDSTYHDQILVGPGAFLKGGDSGSLMVEDVATNPRPIGLLFAGSDTVAVANPIQHVLDALEVSFVGIQSVVEEVKAESTPKVVPDSSKPKAAFFTKTNLNKIERVKAIKDKHAPMLLQINGVVGHAVGLPKDNSQNHVILVLVERTTDEVRNLLPTHLEGIPLEVLVVGKVKAF